MEQPVSRYPLVTSAGPGGVTAASPLHSAGAGAGPSAVSSPSTNAGTAVAPPNSGAVGLAVAGGMGAAVARSASPATSAGGSHPRSHQQQVGRHPGVSNPSAGYNGGGTSSGSSGGQGLGIDGAPMARWSSGSHRNPVTVTTTAFGPPPSGMARGGGMGPGFPPTSSPLYSDGLAGGQTLGMGYNAQGVSAPGALNRGLSVPGNSNYGQMPPTNSAAMPAATAGMINRGLSLPADLNGPSGHGVYGGGAEGWNQQQQGFASAAPQPPLGVGPAPAQASAGSLAPVLGGGMQLENPGLVRVLQKALEEQWPAAKMQQLLATLSDSDLQTLMQLTAQPGAAAAGAGAGVGGNSATGGNAGGGVGGVGGMGGRQQVGRATGAAAAGLAGTTGKSQDFEKQQGLGVLWFRLGLGMLGEWVAGSSGREQPEQHRQGFRGPQIRVRMCVDFNIALWKLGVGVGRASPTRSQLRLPRPADSNLCREI